MAFEAVEKLSFFEQPLDRNHAFDRILKKKRALQAHFFFPCINSEVRAPGIYEFAPQILFYACCRTKHKSRNAAFLQTEDVPKGTSFFCLKIENLCKFIQFAQKSQMNFVRKYGK